MITIDELSVRHGGRTLFAGASIQFNPACRYGIVGANGAGKSTLLRILWGEELPTSGTVGRPRDVALGYLVQDQYRHEHDRILDVVLMGRPALWKALVEKEQLLDGRELGDAEGLRLAELEDQIAAHDGYAAEGEAGGILEGLGIPTERHTLPLSSLSGGFKLRVLLARLLFARPDVILLDEPTNHLDIVSIRWLERYLAESPATILVVSHDQQFLNNVCTHIVDVDYSTVTLYPGNFDAFVARKQLDREQKEAAISKQEKRKDELETFITRFKAKATKAKQAQSKAKMLEKMEEIELPKSSRRFPAFGFTPCRHSGVIPLKITGVTKSFDGRRVLDRVSFEIARGDRVAVIGPNGIGKSTLLKILMQQLPADAGELTWGYEAHLGYFPQDHREVITGSHTLESWLWQFEPSATIGKIRGLLGRALFSGDEATKKIDVLSGGEASRLILAKLMLVPHNVLIFDEPTNHLDLEAIDQLGRALGTYAGTILCVSHNRYFVGQLANRILEITPEGIRDYRGTYAEYLGQFGLDYLDRAAAPTRASVTEPSVEAASARPASAVASKALSKKALNLQRKRDQLEAEVSRLESQVQAKREALERLDATGQLAGYQELRLLEEALEQAFANWEAACIQLDAELG